MIITIHTVADDRLSELKKLTEPNRLEYCLRHGYQLRMNKFVSTDFYFMEVERLLQLSDALLECNWLVSMGTDAVFTNMNTRFEDIIEKHKEADVIVSKDVNHINSDIMLMKNKPQVRNWLFNLLSKTKECLAYQFAIPFTLSEGFVVKIIHQKEINAMPYWLYDYPDHKGGQWEEGDFIFHAAGMTIPDKITVINEVLAKVVR